MSLLEELQEHLCEDPWSSDLPEEWEVVDSGDWTDCHKAEAKADIVKHKSTGKFFLLDFYRTGDHWQGYETEFCGAQEVEPYEATVTLYRPVENALLAATIPAMSTAKEVQP